MTPPVRAWFIYAAVFAFFAAVLWLIGRDYSKELQFLGGMIGIASAFCVVFGMDEWERPID